MRIPVYDSQVTAQMLSNTAAVDKQAVRNPGNVGRMVMTGATIAGLERNKDRAAIYDRMNGAFASSIMDLASVAAAGIGYNATLAAGNVLAQGGTIQEASDARKVTVSSMGDGIKSLKDSATAFLGRVVGSKHEEVVPENPQNVPEKAPSVPSFMDNPQAAVQEEPQGNGTGWVIAREMFPRVAAGYDRGVAQAQRRTQQEDIAGRRYFNTVQRDMNSAIAEILNSGDVESYDERFREVMDSFLENGRGELSPGAYQAYEDAAYSYFNSRHEQMVNTAAGQMYQSRVAMFQADMSTAIFAGDPSMVEDVIRRGIYGDPEVQEDQRIRTISEQEGEIYRKNAVNKMFKRSLISQLDKVSEGQAISMLLGTSGARVGEAQTISWEYYDENGELQSRDFTVGLTDEERTGLVQQYENRQKSRDDQRRRTSEYFFRQGQDNLPQFLSGEQDFYQFLSDHESTIDGDHERMLIDMYTAALDAQTAKTSKEYSSMVKATMAAEAITNNLSDSEFNEMLVRELRDGGITWDDAKDLLAIKNDQQAADALLNMNSQLKEMFTKDNGTMNVTAYNEAVSQLRVYFSSPEYLADSEMERQLAFKNITDGIVDKRKRQSALAALASAANNPTQIFSTENGWILNYNRQLEESYEMMLNGSLAGLEDVYADEIKMVQQKALSFAREINPNLQYTRDIAGIPVFRDQNNPGREYYLDLDSSGKTKPELRELDDSARRSRSIFRENQVRIGNILQPPALTLAGENDPNAPPPYIYLQSGYVKMDPDHMETFVVPNPDDLQAGWRIIHPISKDAYGNVQEVRDSRGRPVREYYYLYNHLTGEVSQFLNDGKVNEYISQSGGGSREFMGNTYQLYNINDLALYTSAILEAIETAGKEKTNE